MSTVEMLAVFGSLVYVVQSWLCSWDGERMERTRITYWIRVSDSAFMESSPAEIQAFLAKDFTPDIRIYPEASK